MEITVNKERISFTLEREENLLEIISSLKSWLGDEGYEIASATHDDQPIDLVTTDALAKVAISSVERLDVSAVPLSENEIARLTAVRQYFQILRSRISARDVAGLSELLAEYKPLREGLPGLLTRFGMDAPYLSPALLDRLVVESGLLAGKLPEPETVQEIIDYAERAESELGERISELADPRRALSATGLAIKGSIEELRQVPILLQTGKDRAAMEAIIRFAELTVKLIRLIPLLRGMKSFDLAALSIDGVTFPEFYAEFNGVLSELIDAFSGGDSVLIGDLLEYEVAPRLEKLSSFVDLIVSA